MTETTSKYSQRGESIRPENGVRKICFKRIPSLSLDTYQHQYWHRIVGVEYRVLRWIIGIAGLMVPRDLVLIVIEELVLRLATIGVLLKYRSQNIYIFISLTYPIMSIIG